MDFPTTRYTIVSQREAEQAVRRLIQSSTWFQVMPLPDDLWEFTVKREVSERIFNELISSIT